MKKAQKFALLSAAAVVLSPLLSPSASADPDPNQSSSGLADPAVLALITDDDLFATADLAITLSSAGANAATRHYGPYPSDSPDSGTCGNAWAQDTFDRHFTVKSRHDGTFTVIQQFKEGRFVTAAGPSPGSCQPESEDGSPPGTVNAGITGKMHGYFIIPLPPGTVQTSTDSSCVAGSPSTPCTTTGFINSHFTPCYPGSCPVTTFFFRYTAPDQQLVEGTWRNASQDRGGNRGDIRSTNL